MCCTIEPSSVSGTIVSCIEARHPTTGKLIHVVGYKNKAKSGVANAMLLPFPSRVRMGHTNVVDTQQCKEIMSDYVLAACPPMFLCFGDSGGVDVFDAGSYTVVLASNASEIPAALGQVPADRRPALNQEYFDAYAAIYPANDWQLALCCWNGDVDAEPIMWWYEPNDPTRLFLPGLDAHDGKPPVLDSMVDVDHTLVVGSNLVGVQSAAHVEFSSHIPEHVLPFIASKVIGIELHDQQMINGDWWFNVSLFSAPDFAVDATSFTRATPI